MSTLIAMDTFTTGGDGMTKRSEVFRVQGLNPDTGVFTEIYTNSADYAKRIADMLYFGEIRLNKYNILVYRDGKITV